jgi:subtilisin family serine protease
MRKLVLAIIAFLACATSARADNAKFHERGPNGIPGQYIVILKDSFLLRNEKTADVNRLHDQALTDGAVSDLRGRYHFTPRRTWTHVLRGFIMIATSDEALRLAHDPSVLLVEQDARPDRMPQSATPSCNVSCTSNQAMPLNTRAFPTSPQSIVCSSPDPGSLPACIDNWGLDRTDQAGLPRDGSYVYSNNGAGVHVYVVDSGVLSTHRELAGKIGQGYNATCVGCNLDQVLCNNHGTTVTSVIAGNTYGVARGVTIHPVQILRYCTQAEIDYRGYPPLNFCWEDANGLDPRVLLPSVSTYVSAFNWVVQHHAANPGPAVLNLSGANDSTFVGSLSFINAAKAVISSGVSFVQAAGNQNDNACNYSVHQADPSYNIADAIVVGGYTEIIDGGLHNGRWADSTTSCPTGDCGSNYGSCVDLWAPAQWVIGAGRWYDGNNPPAGYCYLTGTSLSAPHVTGAIARYLQNHPTATPQQVKTALLNGAVLNVLQTSGTNGIGSGSPNKLLQFVP